MKRLMSLMSAVLADASTRCRTSTTRDLEQIARRIEHEGISFLTICLPSFCQDFERSLSDQKVDPAAFEGFSKVGALPRFLGGLLDLVFDRSTGSLLSHPDIDAIFFVRQITLLCKKINLECKPHRTNAAFLQYETCDEEVRNFESTVTTEKLDAFSRAASFLYASVLAPLERDVFNGTLVPRHGPGSTADGVLGNKKYHQVSWTQRLERYFPAADFILPNFGWLDHLERVDFLSPETEKPVRVISVPKTLKTPRIIAMEPLCMQYAQQAIAVRLVELLEGGNLQTALGFTDQELNKNLARIASKDLSLATLDLKEASDRVSNLLVNLLTDQYPALQGAIQACRSTKASLPNGNTRVLARFASMGSALCFPIEAMVFLTVVFIGYQRARGPVSFKDRETFLKSVRIYGDDIIIPVDIVREVLSSLEDYGFRVNDRKSFWNGKFRESCGGDYYDGCDVSVTYVRTMPPQNARSTPELVSWACMRNLFYERGLWQTAQYLDEFMESLIPWPLVSADSAVLGRRSLLGYSQQRLCRFLHAPLVRGCIVKAKRRRSRATDLGAMLKFFLKPSDYVTEDKDHLEYYGRPLSVYTKIGWARS